MTVLHISRNKNVVGLRKRRVTARSTIISKTEFLKAQYLSSEYLRMNLPEECIINLAVNERSNNIIQLGLIRGSWKLRKLVPLFFLVQNHPLGIIYFILPNFDLLI